MKRQKKKKIKSRSSLARNAWNKTGSGQHKDQTKYDRKKNDSIINEY